MPHKAQKPTLPADVTAHTHADTRANIAMKMNDLTQKATTDADAL